MSILRTYNLQNPDSATTNIELTADGGAVVSGVSTVSQLNVDSGAVISGVTTITGNLEVSEGITATSITGVSTAGITTAYIGSVNDGPISGARNRIINGGMDVWQRGTSFTSINNIVTYGADRWFAFTTSGTAQARILQNGSVPSGFAYSLALGRASGNTATSQQFICQCIESANVLGLAGQSVTLSFYAKAGANYSGGSISAILSSGTASDESSATFSAGPCTGYTGNATVINTTQSINTTWTRYSFTGTVGASALELGLGIGYTPTGTAGADDNIYITGVQLEAGTVATPFERRSYGQELSLCRRYYYKRLSPNVNIASYVSGVYTGWRVFCGSFPVRMRSTPTLAATVSFDGTGTFSGTSQSVDAFSVYSTQNSVNSYMRLDSLTASAEL